MKYTSHSEYLPLYSVVIKTASDSFINEDKLEAEWEALNYLGKPELLKSNTEYEIFENILKEQGVEIIYSPMDTTLSLDAIYCRDASIATNDGMIICTMGKQERALEPEAQRKSFLANGIPVLGTIQAPGTLEGGDVAWLNQKTLAVGLTYRTNLDGIEQLRTLLDPQGVTVITVALPHYKGVEDVFHLMSIFSPVDKDLAVVYSPLMPIRFRNLLLEMDYKLVEVPEEEFESMGCNVLAIGPRKCVMVEGNPKTRQALENAGCEVLVYSGKEISIKGGGGPTCLTRPIKRLK
ncbi:MAG: N-dimethylarginine dimethylaminohydrolase [Maribacter sp.]|jgi:N-dimethylarginine dimethylaminohydrolase